MGADGGVTLFDYEKVKKYLESEDNRLAIAEEIRPKKYGSGDQIVKALLDNDLNQLSNWHPFIGFSSLKINDLSISVLSVSFGTNVDDSINELGYSLSANCNHAVIWSNETWT